MMSPNLISYPGGETNFPSLGIAVKPKKGRALLWPSTLDAQPDQIDIRTTQGAVHESNYIHFYFYSIANDCGYCSTSLYRKKYTMFILSRSLMCVISNIRYFAFSDLYLNTSQRIIWFEYHPFVNLSILLSISIYWNWFWKAKPVIQGKKFAANSWIHLYDFTKPNLWGCTGTFDEL